MKLLGIASVLALGLTGCQEMTDAENGSSTTIPAATAPDRDNTGINVRDRAESAKTPIDQNENQSDIDVTANIRKQVVDTEMSVNAQNVKIITQNGKVLLRGPVKSDDEKAQIEKIAVQVAGAGNVDNQLEVETQP